MGSVLILLFVVFNIGLPIALSSCPMSSLSCPFCSQKYHHSGAAVGTVNANSCCSTKIAADRNTNEFLQSKKTNPDNIFLTFVTPLPISMTVYESSFSIESDGALLTSDMFLHNTSLLI